MGQFTQNSQSTHYLLTTLWIQAVMTFFIHGAVLEFPRGREYHPEDHSHRRSTECSVLLLLFLFSALLLWSHQVSLWVRYSRTATRTRKCHQNQHSQSGSGGRCQFELETQLLSLVSHQTSSTGTKWYYKARHLHRVVVSRCRRLV